MSRLQFCVLFVFLCVAFAACAAVSTGRTGEVSSAVSHTPTRASAGPGYLVSGLPKVPSLTREFFERHALGVSSEVFAQRWSNSLESPLIFFRSHVRAFYEITLKLVPPVTATGLCFGDAHLANFGFIEGKDGGARFLYNDLDDSGICPIAIDALRYFTSLRFLESDDLVKKQIELFVSVLRGEKKPVKIDGQFEPNFTKIRAQVLRKSTNASQEKFKRVEGAVEEVDPAVAAEVSSFTQGLLLAEGEAGAVDDVVLSAGRGGGSFGLVRYWVLVKGKIVDVVEVKETVEPATSFQRWGQVPGDRMHTLKKVFWGGELAARIYGEGSLLGKKYVVRSRVKAAVNPEKLNGTDRALVYNAQVSLLASLRPCLSEISNLFSFDTQT